MEIWKSITSALGFGKLEQRVSTSSRQFVRRKRMTEAFLGFDNIDAGTKDSDEFFKRVVVPVSELDLPDEKLAKGQRLSVLIYRKNVRAWNAIELIKDFVVGPGIRVTTHEPLIKERLQRHWRVNRWQMKLPERVRALALMGEQLYPVFVQPETGLVRVGNVSPLRIVRVKPDLENDDEVDRIFANLAPPGTSLNEDAAKGMRKEYRILRPGLDGPFEITEDEFQGKTAFYFAVNRIGGGRRGIPDMMPALDWLEGIDSFAFNLLERAAFAQQVVWDLKVDGADDEQTEEMSDKVIDDIVSGSVFVHNDKVTLTVKSPQLGASDAETVYRILLKNVHAGLRLAGLFFGDSDDLTRASASEIVIPVGRAIEARQMFIKDMLEQIFQLDIEQGIEAGALPEDIDTRFEVKMPRIYLRDLATATKALNDLSTSLSVAEDQQWVTKTQAKEIFALGIEQLGSLASEDVDDSEILPVDLQRYGKAVERALGRNGGNGTETPDGAVERGIGEVPQDLRPISRGTEPAE